MPFSAGGIRPAHRPRPSPGAHRPGALSYPDPGIGTVGGSGRAGNARSALPSQHEAVDMARMRVCSCISCPAHPGSCPELTTARRCQACGQQAEARRGSRQARGYDAAHERERARWEPKVQLGGVHCHAVRCLMPARLILLGQAWDLGHTADRTAWTGPEHSVCNRSAGGKAAHGQG